jgi:predicted MPP superfamily phosphohydrolase
VNGQQAILDRPASAEAGVEPVRAGAAAPSDRGPWLQLGSVQRFAWSRFELPVASLPPALAGLRVLQLSDLHLKTTWHPAIDDLHERLRHDPPDLVLMTGDFVEDKFDPRPALPLLERFVRGLRSRFGVYAVAGNHDGDFQSPRIARLGVNLLPVGEVHTLDIRGARLELLGLAGLDRHDLRLQHVLDLRPDHGRSPRPPRLVLSHYPDALVMLQKHGVGADLFFAGHTHGGQVCLPGGLPIIRHDTLPRRYCSGVHRLGESWLIVSRGMGFSKYTVRLFCPAEVVEVVLTPSPSGTASA